MFIDVFYYANYKLTGMFFQFKVKHDSAYSDGEEQTELLALVFHESHIGLS